VDGLQPYTNGVQEGRQGSAFEQEFRALATFSEAPSKVAVRTPAQRRSPVDLPPKPIPSSITVPSSLPHQPPHTLLEIQRPIATHELQRNFPSAVRYIDEEKHARNWASIDGVDERIESVARREGRRAPGIRPLGAHVDSTRISSRPTRGPRHRPPTLDSRCLRRHASPSGAYVTGASPRVYRRLGHLATVS